MKFANKSQFGFDPLKPTALDLVTTGTAYETPADHRETLGDLARLSDLRAKFRYSLELNQATTAGVVNVKLMAGTVELATVAIDPTTATRFTGALDVDVSEIAASTSIRALVDVGTSCDVGTTAAFGAVLNIEHPVVITGC